MGQAGSSGKLDALRPSGSGSNTKSAAEVRMALYLRHRSIEILHDAIGINVAPCISSARFLLGLGWQIRDESPVVRADWLVPPEVHEEGKKVWVASAVTGALGAARAPRAPSVNKMFREAAGMQSVVPCKDAV